MPSSKPKKVVATISLARHHKSYQTKLVSYVQLGTKMLFVANNSC